MILVINPRLAGPLSVAIAGLRKWYRAPDPKVRDDLAQLQSVLQQAANDGQRRPPFDLDDLLAQSGRMKPLAVTYEVAAEMLGCGVHTIQRRAKSGELATIGEGRGTRVVVASLEDYVARASTLERTP